VSSNPRSSIRDLDAAPSTRRWPAVLLLLFGLSGCGSTVVRQSESWSPTGGFSEECRQAILASLVLIKVPRVPDANSLEEFQLGTGFFWNQTTVVTCGHNLREVEASEPTYDLLCNGQTLRARLIGRDDRLDLAVLRLETLPAVRLPLPRRSDAPPGLQVFLVGYPQSRNFSCEEAVFSQGIVSGHVIARTPNGAAPQEYLLVDAVGFPGQSGGPAMDMSGRIVGMIKAILTSGDGVWQGFTFLTSVTEIEAAVQRLTGEESESDKKL